jgi:hypothetical protein
MINALQRMFLHETKDVLYIQYISFKNYGEPIYESYQTKPWALNHFLFLNYGINQSETIHKSNITQKQLFSQLLTQRIYFTGYLV